jgi:reactive intermediate/imine deaminase
MSNKSIIETDDAPKAIGTYSQAVKLGHTVYLSGQIPLDAVTMKLVPGDFSEQTSQVFKNLRAVCRAAGGDLADIVKLTVYMTDLSQFTTVNEVMATYFQEPFPARAVIGVAQLPKGAEVEMDAIMAVS